MIGFGNQTLFFPNSMISWTVNLVCPYYLLVSTSSLIIGCPYCWWHYSGYFIGQQALISVMHAHDGRGPPTNLVNAILNRLGLTSPEDIVRYGFKCFISIIFSCYYENNLLFTFMKAALFIYYLIYEAK